MKAISATVLLLLALPGAYAGETSLTLVDASRCLHLRLHTDTDVVSSKYERFAGLAAELQRRGKSGYIVLGIYDEVGRVNVDGLALCRYEYNKTPAAPTDQPDGFSCADESHPDVAGLAFRTFGRYGAFASAFVCHSKCPAALTPSLYDTSSDYSDHRDQIREDLALMRKQCKAKR